MRVDFGEQKAKVLDAVKILKKRADIWRDNEKVLEVLGLFHKIYYSQIHENLELMNNDAGEAGIRECVKEIIKYALPLCEDKLKSTKKMSGGVVARYLAIYDDLYALASMRSLAHFVRYMEFDTPVNKQIWKPTMHLFGGFWYYANSMVLNGDVKFISKQCFTGLGKTYSNAMLLAYIFGYDINADALYVFGASENVGTFTLGVIDIMISQRYAKVFPYYQKFMHDSIEETIAEMFLLKQVKDTGSKFRINGSAKPVNLRVVSKAKNTNGVRAKYLFVDDIAQLADANNPKEHDKDKFRFTNEWFRRNYDLTNFYVIAGGTTYSVDDILMYLLQRNNGDIAEVSPVNRFTKIAKSNFITKDGLAAFVVIPKLDYETDESVYPEKYPTEEARMQRDNSLDNGRMFEAMEQQRPLSSVDNPFDWGNIRIYDEIPEGNGTYRFILDPSRKGNDKTCCLFFKQVGNIHYLVDAFLDKQPLDYVYPNGKTVMQVICDKIISHHCIEGSAEENTESTIKTQLTKMLQEMGWLCKIDSYYSWKVKKDKIYAAQTTIQSYINFPSRRVFPANSEVGRAMQDITYWKYKDNIADDAPECCANYCEIYIKFNNQSIRRAITFKR